MAQPGNLLLQTSSWIARNRNGGHEFLWRGTEMEDMNSFVFVLDNYNLFSEC